MSRAEPQPLVSNGHRDCLPPRASPGVSAHLLVVLLQHGQILTGLGELAPPPCPRPRTSARRRAWRTSGRTCGPDGPRPRRWQVVLVSMQTGAMHLGQVTARHHGWGVLVVDTNLKKMNQNGVVDQQCTTCH